MADLELKFANLSNRDSPARKANRETYGNTSRRFRPSRSSFRLARRHRAGHPCGSPTGTRADAHAGVMTIDTERLRELAAELGFWPATTDEG